MTKGKLRIQVVTDLAVPYGGGMSVDNKTIYIDSSIPKRLAGVDVLKSIEFHETVEHALMDLLGVPYPEAHELATLVEHHRLVQLGLDAGKYEAALKPYLKDADKQVRSGDRVDVPVDLDLEPYRDSKDLTMVRILTKLQQEQEADGDGRD